MYTLLTLLLLPQLNCYALLHTALHCTALQPELILRCIDGESLGAIPGCPEPGCKGKLRLDAGGKVTCGGAYSDELASFVRCYYSAQASAIKRLPWREAKPSDGEACALLLSSSSSLRPVCVRAVAQ